MIKSQILQLGAVATLKAIMERDGVLGPVAKTLLGTVTSHFRSLGFEARL